MKKYSRFCWGHSSLADSIRSECVRHQMITGQEPKFLIVSESTIFFLKQELNKYISPYSENPGGYSQFEGKVLVFIEADYPVLELGFNASS